MRNKAVQEHFSKLAEEGVWASLYEHPDQLVTAETWSFISRARCVMELLQLHEESLEGVLDVGCGTAPIARSVVAMDAHYTGIDFSSEMIESTQVNLQDLIRQRNAEFAVGDITNLEFPDESFTAVIAMGVIEYLTMDQVHTALREVRRVLRPGGLAILTIPKRWHWEEVVLGFLYPVRKYVTWRPHWKNLKLEQKEDFRRLTLTPFQLDRACREAGISKVDHRHYNVQLVTRPATLVAPRMCYLINSPLEGLSRVPLVNFLASGYIGTYRPCIP